MENSNVLKRRLTFILLMAILGAVSANGVILIVALADNTWVSGKPPGLMKEWLTSFSVILSIPTALVTPQNGKLANPYVVNGLLGAVIFGLGGVLWQFVFRRKENNYASCAAPKE
jgi:hypothetical protein